MKNRIYLVITGILMTLAVAGQTADESIKRSVTLYNPYKPSLSEASKRILLPASADTTKVNIVFSYDVRPGRFVPQYSVSPIKAAVLSPDPLPALKNGYVSLGLGTYLTPFLEVSVSNGRSKKGSVGLFTRSYGSAGRMTLENDDIVFAGFMDNQAILYGKKYYRNSRLDADLDFRQMSRYAYGYDPDITGFEPERKDIRSLYYDFTATARYFSTEPDSSGLIWDATLRYNLFSRAGDGFQNNPGLTLKMGKNMIGMYGGADLSYDMWLSSSALDTRTRNLFRISPYLTRGNEEWRFRFGARVAADIREDVTPLGNGNLKPYLYFYPDVLFTFRVIPHFLRFTAAVDGDLENNMARSVVYQNPWLMPGDTLFTLRNTDNKLRILASLTGNLNVSSTWSADISYTLFNDMLLFYNDTIGVGNYFLPLYDDGGLLKASGEVRSAINDQLTMTLRGAYYKYDLSHFEYAWHKPSWDAGLKAEYNLRNKIVASADLTVTGERYALVRYPVNVVKFPVHPNLNLGVEYRYTPALSFWLKCNNISYRTYYEWNYYPSRNFMLLGGFTYSL